MVLQIFYEWWGGNPGDRRFWTSRIKGESEAYDYGTKEQLKYQAISNGWGYEILRHHRDGRVSVIETYEDFTEVLTPELFRNFKFKQ